MDIKTTQQLNVTQTSAIPSKTSAQNLQIDADAKFIDELSKAGKEKTEDAPVKEEKAEEDKSVKETKQVEEAKPEEKNKENEKTKEKKVEKSENPQPKKEQKDNAIDGLEDIVSEISKISQKDDKSINEVKINENFTDMEEKDTTEDNNLIDNNMNVQDTAEKVNIHTETGTNFNNNGQPFAEFINQEQKTDKLKSTDKELAEEKAILSTMEENVAIARKNMLLKEKAEKTEGNSAEKVQDSQNPVQKKITIQNDEGIKKVDAKTHLTVENIVSYENVVMDKADVDFFVNLVNDGEVNISDIQGAQKSAQVSKTLADLLAKAMNENKPVRIDFDNDISVIIKIDRAGKISADFLPSSQVAEAYLRENLPLLRQRFNDNNIDYNELNQRKQKQDNPENRKKGRKDE